MLRGRRKGRNSSLVFSPFVFVQIGSFGTLHQKEEDNLQSFLAQDHSKNLSQFGIAHTGKVIFYPKKKVPISAVSILFCLLFFSLNFLHFHIKFKA